jgi:hypothetical protein
MGWVKYSTLGANWGVDIGSRPTELIDGRIGTAITNLGILDTAVPEDKGGTGLTSAGNAIVNSRVQMNTDGSLTYSNNGSGAVTMNTLADAGNIRSRINAGLAVNGDVNRSVPQGQGGTGLTSNSTILNTNTTKANVGLGNVDNTSDATVLGGELTGSLNSTAFPMRAMVTGANAAAVKTTIALNLVNNSSDATIQAGTTKANVGLGSVANESRATILGGELTGSLNSTTFPMSAMVTGANAAAVKTTIALQNVDNTSDATVLGGELTGSLNATTFPMSAMVTGANAAAVKTTIALQNVNNTSDATVLGGELTGSLNSTAFPMRAMVTGADAAAVKTTIALQNVNNTSDATVLAATHTGAVSGDVTGKVNNIAVATVTAGAASGATANQDSTATIRNGVTTYEIDYAGFSGSWTNISGQIEPAAVSFALTITWRNGSGTSLGTSVVTVARNSGGTALIAATVAGSGAHDSISLGSAANSGVIQVTTVTKNSVPVKLTAMITDGSGWGFK